MSGSERYKELKRRRRRKKKLNIYRRRAASANSAEKEVLAEKIRRTTPGAQVIIDRWELEQR